MNDRLPSYVVDRSAVRRFSLEDPGRALAIARAIDQPWYRCQSLANVAEHLPDGEQKRQVLREAFAAADQTAQPNRIVTVAYWPLRVVAQMGDREWLVGETDRLLQIIRTEPHPIRRGDGLSWLSNAADGDPVLGERIAREATETFLSARGWRRDQYLAYRAAALYSSDPAEAITLIGAIWKRQYRNRALRMIGLLEPPRRVREQ